jgi:flagellar motility protein MotE (MotC chaperone)
MVDSTVTEETVPIQQEVGETKADLVETQQQLDELQRLLAVLSSDADSIDQANARKLSKIVEKMKPADAASVLESLSAKTTAQILLTMRQRNAARVLAAMPRQQAAEIARFLSRAYARSAI